MIAVSLYFGIISCHKFNESENEHYLINVNICLKPLNVSTV